MTPDAATARRLLRAGMFPPAGAPEAPPAALSRPVGTRVVVRTLDVPEQIIGTGTVTRVIHADRVWGHYCRVEIDYGTDVGIYFRYAAELDIAPTAG